MQETLLKKRKRNLFFPETHSNQFANSCEVNNKIDFDKKNESLELPKLSMAMKKEFKNENLELPKLSMVMKKEFENDNKEKLILPVLPDKYSKATCENSFKFKNIKLKKSLVSLQVEKPKITKENQSTKVKQKVKKNTSSKSNTCAKAKITAEPQKTSGLNFSFLNFKQEKNIPVEAKNDCRTLPKVKLDNKIKSKAVSLSVEKSKVVKKSQSTNVKQNIKKKNNSKSNTSAKVKIKGKIIAKPQKISGLNFSFLNFKQEKNSPIEVKNIGRTSSKAKLDNKIIKKELTLTEVVSKNKVDETNEIIKDVLNVYSAGELDCLLAECNQSQRHVLLQSLLKKNN